MTACRRVCVVVGMAVGIILGLATLLIMVAVIRAATLEDIDYQELGVDTGVTEELPTWYLDTLPQLMARALSIPTVSTDVGQYDTEQLLRFHQFLRESFPEVFNTTFIRVEVINTYSLLFTIMGKSQELQPYMLMGHMDVVPVEADKWMQDPWGGHILPDPLTGHSYIWGRGAIDNKLSVMGIIMALQYLAKTDFQPTRSFYVAFGHDEEVHGADGAGHIAKVLEARGVKLDFLLDEGLPVLDKVLTGMDVPIAMIGVTEKGYLTLNMEVEGEGGHSSIPPRNSVIARLAAAVSKLETYQQPAMFGQGPEADFFAYIAPKASWPHKLVYANLWLFKPLVQAVMAGRRDTNALVRTTTAVTIVRAGTKENVVPTSASAVVNHRIHSSHNLEDVLDYDRYIIDDPTVKLNVKDGMRPLPVSPYGAEVDGWRLITAAIHHHFPSTVTAPAVMVANTDSVYYLNLTSCVYRFFPINLKSNDLSRIHGANERISVSQFLQATRFYHRVMVWAGIMVGNTDTRYYLNMTSCIYRFEPLMLTLSDLVTIHGHNERIKVSTMGKAASFYYHLILAANNEVTPLLSLPGHRAGEF